MLKTCYVKYIDGRPYNTSHQNHSTYSCELSRAFEPGKSWLPYYRLQKRRRGEGLGKTSAGVGGRQSGEPTAPHPLEVPPCPAHPSFCLLPDQQMAVLKSHIAEKNALEEKRRSQKCFNSALDLQEEMRQKKQKSCSSHAKNVHWSVQRQKELEREYAGRVEQYNKLVKQLKCPQHGINKPHFEALKGQVDVLPGVETEEVEPLPPGDIMEPRETMSVSRKFKGIHLPSEDPRFERLLPANRDTMTMTCSLNPFDYMPRSRSFHGYHAACRRITLDCDPSDWVGHSSTVRRATTSSRTLSQRSHVGYGQYTSVQMW